MQKEHFRHFIKVTELAQFYNEITDYRTVENVGVNAPTSDEYMRISELYGFPLLVKTELQLKSNVAARKRKIQLSLVPST